MRNYHLVAMKHVHSNVKSLPAHKRSWQSRLKAAATPKKAVCAVPGLWDSCLKKGGAQKPKAADYGAKRRLRTGDMTCARQAVMERGASANSTKSASSHCHWILVETSSAQPMRQWQLLKGPNLDKSTALAELNWTEHARFRTGSFFPPSLS